MPDNTVRLPDFVVPKGETADGALRRMAFDGLEKIDKEKNQDYINRLVEELEVISSRDFSKYFLTVKAIVDKASDMMLQGSGRGSVAGSLLAYVLKITQVDPLRWNLPFSRFLRKDATDYPDIDTDVSFPTELKNKLIEDWGQNNVVKISNWNTLQLRSLIKDVAKFYNVPWVEVNNTTSKMLFEAIPLAKLARGIKAGVYVPTFDEVMMYSETLQLFMKKYPVVRENVVNLHGQVKSCFTDDMFVLTNNGEKHPSEIKSTDSIAFYTNENEIDFNDDWELIFQGTKEVYKITLEDGYELELTEEHEVLTQRGYVMVKSLNKNDKLFSIM